VGENPDEVRITLRLQKTQHEEVVEESKANKRSLNSEIQMLIDDGLKYRRGEKSPKENRSESLNRAAA
jgi:hypothetical protein